MNKLVQKYIEILEEKNLIISSNISDDILKEEVLNITCNSKEVKNNSIFICKGINYKSDYLEEAINKGILLYIAEKENITREDFPYIMVSDVRASLAIMAQAFYDYPERSINMIGITGTKGKSTTAYYVKSIIDNFMDKNNSPKTAILSSINNYNGEEEKESLLTTPESLDLERHIRTAVNNNIKNLVMEVSSQAVKFKRIYDINYKVGAFLNISEDHISSIEHPNFEDYFNSKLDFFKQVDNLCINLDSDYIDIIKEKAKSVKNVITFSTKDSDSDVYAYNIEKVGLSEINFKVRTKEFDKPFKISMPGIFNVENALAAISIALVLEIPYENIYEGLKIARASGRMEAHVTLDGKTIAIVDYAHNKLSFKRLYESIKKEYPGKKIVTVFGCPGGKAQIRRKDLGLLSGEYSNMTYLTAEDPGPESVKDISLEIAKYVKEKNGEYKIIEDRGEAIKTAIKENYNSVILITGKGNETRQKYGKEYIPCLTDTDYVLEAFKEYNEKEYTIV